MTSKINFLQTTQNATTSWANMPLICAALDMGHSNITHMQEELGKSFFSRQ